MESAIPGLVIGVALATTTALGGIALQKPATYLDLMPALRALSFLVFCCVLAFMFGLGYAGTAIGRLIDDPALKKKVMDAANPDFALLALILSLGLTLVVGAFNQIALRIEKRREAEEKQVKESAGG